MGKISEILSGKRIYLDANVFIYLLEGYPAYVQALTELFSLIDRDELQAVTSELTLAETLVKPIMDSNLDLQQAYQNMLLTTSSLEVVPINTDILIEAATLRAKNRQIKLPDAIHATTAYVNQCQAFITNDKSLKRIPDIEVVILSDIAALLASND